MSSAAEDVLFVGALAGADMSRNDRVSTGAEDYLEAQTWLRSKYPCGHTQRDRMWQSHNSKTIDVFPRLGGHEVKGVRYKGACGDVGRKTSSTETQGKERNNVNSCQTLV